MTDLLPCVEVETAASVDASIIWLHGLGADGHDFEPIVPELGLPGSAAIRFLFPHAPRIPVTVNNGMVMPAWYDILEMTIDRRIDVDHILISAARIQQLIDREIARGIDSRRIVLAGFSQGGAVAYQTALCCPQPLAGLMALSTYFATADSIQPNPVNEGLPILICHGSLDPVVPELLGHKANQRLQAMGYRTQFHSYPMQHSVSLEEVHDISTWLGTILEL